jgi:hypothetical protein
MADEEAITITAGGATIHAGEKVSTGDYENAQVDITLELDIAGVDCSGGIPPELQQRLKALQMSLQRNVEENAEKRREDPYAEAEARR